MPIWKIATAALLFLQGASAEYAGSNEVIGTNSCGLDANTKMSFFDSFQLLGDPARQAGAYIVLNGIDKYNSEKDLCDDTATPKIKSQNGGSIGTSPIWVIYANPSGSGACKNSFFSATFQSSAPTTGGKQIQQWQVKKCN